MSYYYVTGNESSRSGLRGLQNVWGMSKSRRSLLWLVFLGKQVRHHTHREILRKRAVPVGLFPFLIWFGWISYKSGRCTTITSVTPNQLQRTTARTVKTHFFLLLFLFIDELLLYSYWHRCFLLLTVDCFFLHAALVGDRQSADLIGPISVRLFSIRQDAVDKCH